MSGTLNRGFTYSPTGNVTNKNHHSLMDDATVSGIDRGDTGTGASFVTAASADPASPNEQEHFLDTDTDQLKYYNTADTSFRQSQAKVFRGFINGFRGRSVDDTDIITISPGVGLDSTSSYILESTSDLTIDVGTAGAGGLDTGAIATGLYFYHVIGSMDGTQTPAGMASLSATSPTLPGSYDIFRMVGFFVYDAGLGYVLPFTVEGNDIHRLHRWAITGNANTRVLLSGAATTLTTVGTSAVVPAGIAVALELYIIRTATYAGAGSTDLQYGLLNSSTTASAAGNNGVSIRKASGTDGAVTITYYETNLIDIHHTTGEFKYLINTTGSSGNTMSIVVVGAWYNVGAE